jgi:hypothetical protein
MILLAKRNTLKQMMQREVASKIMLAFAVGMYQIKKRAVK